MDQSVLTRINEACMTKDSFPFRIEYCSFTLDEKYVAKMGFLRRGHWELARTYDRTRDVYTKTRNDLSNPPQGITVTEEDNKDIKYNGKKVNDMPIPSKSWDHCNVTHRIKFIIEVSAAYAQSFRKTVEGKKIIIHDNDFDRTTIEDAQQFKQVVLNSHKDILDPLFRNGLLRYGLLKADGFTDDDMGYGLKSVGMKPLPEQYQRLGLILALVKYGQQFLAQGEAFVISPYSGSSGVYVKKMIVQNSSNGLKDW